MHRIELKIPPAIVVFLFALAMWIVAEMSPWMIVQIPAKEWMAGVIGFVGCALIVAGVTAFIPAKTTVNPLTPELTTAIVTGGIYQLSRNPMYVGFLVILAGWGVFLENVLSVLLLPLFVWYLNRFQIIPEEQALLAKFDDEYDRYLKSVRRWI